MVTIILTQNITICETDFDKQVATLKDINHGLLTNPDPKKSKKDRLIIHVAALVQKV